MSTRKAPVWKYIREAADGTRFCTECPVGSKQQKWSKTTSNSTMLKHFKCHQAAWAVLTSDIKARAEEIAGRTDLSEPPLALAVAVQEPSAYASSNMGRDAAVQTRAGTGTNHTRGRVV
jgi:hypothetical protein